MNDCLLIGFVPCVFRVLAVVYLTAKSLPRAPTAPSPQPRHPYQPTRPVSGLAEWLEPMVVKVGGGGGVEV